MLCKFLGFLLNLRKPFSNFWKWKTRDISSFLAHRLFINTLMTWGIPCSHFYTRTAYHHLAMHRSDWEWYFSLNPNCMLPGFSAPLAKFQIVFDHSNTVWGGITTEVGVEINSTLKWLQLKLATFANFTKTCDCLNTVLGFQSFIWRPPFTAYLVQSWFPWPLAAKGSGKMFLSRHISGPTKSEGCWSRKREWVLSGQLPVSPSASRTFSVCIDRQMYCVPIFSYKNAYCL